MTPSPAEGVPRVGVVGCGNWGTVLARNLHALGALHAVSDRHPARAQALATHHGVAAVSLQELLVDAALDAVVVAAPAAAHFDLARQVLAAGKHAFVEKPLALDTETAAELCGMAEQADRVLMVGHLMRYHPAFVELQRLVDEGELGRLQYLYSNRLNLGKIRREEDSLWSFAPHDVSMILTMVGAEPDSVSAAAAAYLHRRIADVTTTHLTFPGGERAHVFVSWLHPFKEHKLVVVGDKAMAVFDDGEAWDRKLQLFRHAIDWRNGAPQPVRAACEPIAVQPQEPVESECRHFLDCVARGSTPLTDGREGLRVLRVLEAAEQSMNRERPVSMGSPMESPHQGLGPDAVVHPSAYVDHPCHIGAGTRIWHFSHVLAGSRIGKHCTLGQNVMIGPDVTVGDNCKIQNNVSLYRGVTLEDGVFCGPSCVFTNVSTPRAEIQRKDEFLPTLVGRGATIGANATIVCGHHIGPWSFIAAGAVVTSNVPAHALMAGVPARRIGWVSHAGERLGDDLVCPRTGRRYVLVAPDHLEEQALDASPPVEGVEDVPPVELVDLKAQRSRLGTSVDKAIKRVLDHGGFVMGPEVGALEEQLASFCGVGHVVTCASGTDGLLIALLGLGLQPGDAVVVPSFTFVATAEVVAFLGGTPVFADVRAETFNLDADSVVDALEAASGDGLRPVGVIPVDLFGQPADHPSVAKVAADHGLWVLADAAQSFGASLHGQRVGSIAPVSATSFFPAKPLGCYGDGGAVFTDDDGLAERMRSVRSHGRGGARSTHVHIGVNGRLDTIQAAVLLAKLEKLEEELVRRAEVAERYHEGLGDVVQVPEVMDGARSAWACYTVRTPHRAALADHLNGRGIATAQYYATPLHRQPAYQRFPTAPAGLPVTDQLSAEVLSLPVHPYLGLRQQDRVMRAILEFFS